MSFAPLNVGTLAGVRGEAGHGRASRRTALLLLAVVAFASSYNFYPVAGQLEGALSTRSLTPIDSGGQLFLRNNGRALVTLSDDARAEVAEGVMVGEVRYSPDGASVFPCASTRHSWALFAR